MQAVTPEKCLSRHLPKVWPVVLGVNLMRMRDPGAPAPGTCYSTEACSRLVDGLKDQVAMTRPDDPLQF